MTACGVWEDLSVYLFIQSHILFGRLCATYSEYKNEKRVLGAGVLSAGRRPEYKQGCEERCDEADLSKATYPLWGAFLKCMACWSAGSAGIWHLKFVFFSQPINSQSLLPLSKMGANKYNYKTVI